ncbi:hypothetical protein DYB36_000725, partial [Aphanomyces astaci]
MCCHKPGATDAELTELEQRILEGNTINPVEHVLPSSRLLKSSATHQSTKLLLPTDSTATLAQPQCPILPSPRLQQSSSTVLHTSSVAHNRLEPVPTTFPDTNPPPPLHSNASETHVQNASLSKLMSLGPSVSERVLPTLNRAMTKDFGRRLSHDFDASQILDALAHMNSSHKAKLAESQKSFVLSLHSPWKPYWDVLKAAAAVYAIVLTHLQLAFHVCDIVPALFVIQVVVDTLFVVDSVLHFNTTFIDANLMEEVFDRRLVFRHYLVGAFVTDWFTSVPLSYFGHVSPYIECLRFGILCRVLKPTCAYIVVTISEAGNGTTRWDSASDLPNSVADQYFHAYYEAITVTGGESMQPTTTLEVFFSGAMPVVGVTIQAWYVYKTQVYDVAPPPQPTILTTAAMRSNSTVGLCAGVFTQIHHVEDDRVQRTDAIHAKLKNCHVEPAVQSRILEYYSSTKGEEDVYNAAELLADLPTTLTLQLQWTLHQAFMRKVPFFQTLEPEGLLTLLQCMEEW